jgi:hypothetical protein
MTSPWNMGSAFGANAVDEINAPEGPEHGQEKGQGRQVLTPEAAVRLGGDSRRLPPDYDGGAWS